MGKPRIRILLVEDDVVDRIACRRALAADQSHQFEIIETETAQDALQRLRSEDFDAVLLDYRLPDQTGLEFLAALADGAGEVPIPVLALTGEESATVAVEMMRHGARDYLYKDQDRHYLPALPAAIERMLRGQRLLEDKRQAEAMFRTLVEQTQAITYVRELGAEGAYRYVSPQVRTLGYTAEEWLADPTLRLSAIHPADRTRAEAAIAGNLAQGTPMRLEYRLTGRDGRERWFRDEAEVVRDPAGRKLFLQGILIDITQDKLAEEALRESREALRRLAAHQESIKESERKRIAQEIHDELGALLTGIKAHVSVSAERIAQAGGTPDPLLVEAARLTEEAIQAVRRVINDLRPSVLDQLGVWEAIAWHVSQVESRFGLVCDCIIAPSAAATEVDADRSIMLFRIVQESLTNVVRHADASLVTVLAAVKDGVVLLEICDDGKGFADESPAERHSWGIQGMQERTRHFGGQLTVSSTAGRGTRVALRLPLADNDGR
ncbi:PAS domain S-box protein [Bordetella genomosp. 9]|uniref:PAS domain S-box protein n=1 Tax=Bordetella genomosp. 9 TaxID=1416803 RepID=A0A261R1I1_9BORD|nr:response regulator [Bordetella genomosp. 9]OZI18856.1 PAS domain S-box protein [Bordetella genomosp. 9]